MREHPLIVPYEPPYDWSAMLEFLAARAVAGIEVVDGDRYLRTAVLAGRPAIVGVEPAAGRSALLVTIRSRRAAAVAAAVVARISAMLDLDADLAAISRHLRVDPLLAPLVAARPGLRVPQAWDPFELAVRAVLGQQITVAAARSLAGKLVAALGEPIGVELGPPVPGLTTTFPPASRMTDPERIGRLGMPRARARTLVSLAAAVASDGALLERGRDRDESIGGLRALPGIGEWTAEYIALRALGDRDAFPAADVGLLRAASAGAGRQLTPDELRERSLPWRPWRAYAAQHLWSVRPGGAGTS